MRLMRLSPVIGTGSVAAFDHLSVLLFVVLLFRADQRYSVLLFYDAELLRKKKKKIMPRLVMAVIYISPRITDFKSSFLLKVEASVMTIFCKKKKNIKQSDCI